MSCHQTKAVLITHSRRAKGLANERRDGVAVFAERDTRVPVQIKGSQGPVFVSGSRFWLAVWSLQGRDVKDLSRAATAFRNKLVREMEPHIYSGGSQCDQSEGSLPE